MNAPTRTLLTLKRSETGGEILEERLHKVLANAGLGSRRLLETRIQAGEVKVNGKVAELGSSVRAGDRVELDAKLFVAINDNAEHAQVLAYHKPEGLITTRDDPEGRPTVFEQLPPLKGARWIAIGRLDINTTGLLLLTTDGALAHALMHPSQEIAREYICRVHGEVPDEALERLQSGVELEDGPAHFDELAVISRGDSHSWFRIVISEGRNREVRRMWESQGLMVSRLKRTRYGCIELPRGLRKSQSEALAPNDVKALRDSCGAGEPEPTLTLQPVIGQRRTKPASEFRPEPRSQQAWVGGVQDEGRELRAFDRVRDEAPLNRGRGKPKGRRPAYPNRNAGAPPNPGRQRRGGAPGAQDGGFPSRPWAGNGQGQPPRKNRPNDANKPVSHGNTFEANEGRILGANTIRPPRAGRPLHRGPRPDNRPAHAGRPAHQGRPAHGNTFEANEGRPPRRPFQNPRNAFNPNDPRGANQGPSFRPRRPRPATGAAPSRHGQNDNRGQPPSGAYPAQPRSEYPNERRPPRRGPAHARNDGRPGRDPAAAKPQGPFRPHPRNPRGPRGPRRNPSE